MITRIEAAEQAVLALRVLNEMPDGDSTDTEYASLLALGGEIACLADGTTAMLAAGVLTRDDRPGMPRLCRTLGYRSPSVLLASMFGMRKSTAMSALGVANATIAYVDIDGAASARLPLLSAALRSGSVSLEQASAFIGGLGVALHRGEASAMAAADAGFVQLAADAEHPMTPENLAQLGRSLAATIDPEQIEPTYEDLRDMRRASMTVRDDGMTRLSALLDPVQAAVVQQVIDAHASPRRSVRFEEDVDHDLSEELGDTRTLVQKKADAVTDVFAIYAASGSAPTVGGEAPTLLVTATYSDLMARNDDVSPFGTAATPRTVAEVLAGTIPSATAQLLHTGAIVPIGVASQLLCDGFMQLVVMNDDGEVLELGRAERLFNRAQKRAMIARDKTCQGPGCTMPAEWCEAHHIVWWSRGGPTDIANGIMLCRFCHSEVHAGRLQIAERPPGRLDSTPHPWGVTRTAARPPRRLERQRI